MAIEGDQVRLQGCSCAACGTVAFPPRKVCAACRSTDVQHVLLGPGGTLYTYAIVRQAPRDFPTPYVIGYVDLDEGVRVFTRVIAEAERDLRLGLRVSLIAAPLRAGDPDGPLAYAFRPEGGTHDDAEHSHRRRRDDTLREVPRAEPD